MSTCQGARCINIKTQSTTLTLFSLLVATNGSGHAPILKRKRKKS